MRPAPIDWKADDKISALFAEAVEKESPYHKALIYYQLNAFRYYGYGDRFIQCLRQSVTDPGAFATGVPELENWEQPGNLDPGLPKNFRHDDTPFDMTAALRICESPMLAAYILKSLPTPDLADQRRFARFLDSSNAALRYTFVNRLADWYGEPELEKPQERSDASGKWVKFYPGLDEAVALWKTKLAEEAVPASGGFREAIRSVGPLFTTWFFG